MFPDGTLQTTAADIGIKAWVNFNGTNGAINDSFGVASVTRNGVGDYTIAWTTPFANTNYCIVGIAHRPTVHMLVVVPSSLAAGSAQIGTFDHDRDIIDGDLICVMAIGDQ